MRARDVATMKRLINCKKRLPGLVRTRERITMSFSSPWYRSTVDTIMPSSNSSRPRSVFLGGLITPTFCSAFWIAFFCPLSDRAQGKHRIRRFASDQRLASSNGGRSHGVMTLTLSRGTPQSVR